MRAMVVWISFLCLQGFVRLAFADERAESVAEIKRFEGPEYAQVHAISPDGRFALSTPGDGRALVLWDLKSGKPSKRYEGHMKPVFGAEFSSDGRRVISRGRDNVAILWDAATGKQVSRAQGHDSLYGAAILPDGRIVTAGFHFDKGASVPSVRVRLTETQKEQFRFSGTTPIAASGSRIAYCCDEGKTVEMADARTGKILRRFVGQPDWIRALAFSSDGRRLLSSSKTGVVLAWDTDTGKQLARCTLRHKGEVNRVAFSPDGRLALSCGRKAGQDRVSSFVDGQFRVTFVPRPGDTRIVLWDIVGGKALANLDGHRGEASGYILSDGRSALTCCDEDRTVRLWKLPSRQE